MVILPVPVGTTKLIAAVKGALGMWWEPHQIKRVARATAEAETEGALIRLQGEFAIEDAVARRALQRVLTTEFRRQINIEAIADKAFAELPRAVTPEPPDPDWVTNFFASCQDVSNEQMQVLWGRLLANEVGKPGSFSRSTVAVVRDMSTEDAQHFALAGRLLWEAGGPDTSAFIPKVGSGYYAMAGLYYLDVLQLGTLGLVNTQAGIYRRFSTPLDFRYGRRHFRAVPSKNVNFEAHPLTPQGMELRPLLAAWKDLPGADREFEDNYVRAVTESLVEMGCVVTPIEQRGASA